MIDWISIRDQVPDTEVPVLFKEAFTEDYHVGFWDEEENGMIEFNTGGDGYKWSVEKWAYIE